MQDETTRRLNRAKKALLRSLQANCPTYTVDINNLEALTSISHWLIREPFNEVRIGTGLILRGPVGTGKTDIMRALSGTLAGAGASGFLIINVKRLVAEFARKGEAGKPGGHDVILTYSEVPHLCFDDVGMEDDGKHFGNVTNVVADLISLRYERWRLGRSITHMTTNLNNAALAEKYDGRTVSRIGEMCSELYVGGDDRRSYAEAPTSTAILPELFGDVVPLDLPTKEEAALHIERIRSTVKQAKEEMEANTPHRVNRMGAPTPQADHLEEFAELITSATGKVLENMRDNINHNNTHEAAKPYLQLVDDEMNRRAALIQLEHTTTT